MLVISSARNNNKKKWPFYKISPIKFNLRRIIVINSSLVSNNVRALFGWFNRVVPCGGRRGTGVGSNEGNKLLQALNEASLKTRKRYRRWMLSGISAPSDTGYLAEPTPLKLMPTSANTFWRCICAVNF